MNQKMAIWIYMIKLVVSLQQQRLLQVNETFTVSQTPTVSSSSGRYRRRITQKERKYFRESYY